MTKASMNDSKNISFHIAIDFVIFGYNEGELKLLVKNENSEQTSGHWSLLSGILEENENLKQAASRILHQLTGLSNVYLEQLYTYSNPDYDPGTRVISVAYYAIIKLTDQNKELVNEFNVKWLNIKEIQEFIIDPEHTIDMALEELREHAKVIPVGITLMPVKFTITQLQAMYEAIFQKKLDRGNFRKNILSIDLLEKLDEKDKANSRKGAWLYRFNEKKYHDLINNGVLIKISI
jgi:8-oxo-dGTP diphosphatase